MQNKVYRQIAQSFNAMNNCIRSDNKEWEDNHRQTIKDICESYLPHGSGIDCGVAFDFDHSTDSRLVFTFGYHQMNENGFYTGWYDYTLTVKPSLLFGYDMRITGKDNNGNKEYFYDLFRGALDQDIEL